MDGPPSNYPSKPFFGTVREQGLRLRFAIMIAVGIGTDVALGFGLHSLGAALTAGGGLAIGMGGTALGVGRWIQPTEAIRLTPAHRSIIKLFIGLALLATLGATVTMSATVGYVAFGLAVVAGVAGLSLLVGPRKRATQPGE